MKKNFLNQASIDLINNIKHDHQEYWDVIKNTSAQLKDGRIKRYLIQKLMKI